MFLSKLRKSEKGATAIEYALIAALIGVGIITMLGNVGTELNNTFSAIDTQLDTANNTAATTTTTP